MAESGSRSEGRSRQLRLGMVGGGQGAFIGAVHRIAARMDDRYRLVAGAFSAEAGRARASGRELGVAEERTYTDFAEMAAAESKRKDGIDVVSVVTPNHLHHRVAKAFLEAGVRVICEKPMTTTLEEARDLVELVGRTRLAFCVCYNYTGYPLVRQAREMVAAGEVGQVRVVQVEYAQDWLTTRLEETGQKQAAWRTNPAEAGAGGCIGDIGTHAFNLAEFVTGLITEQVCAELTTFVPGRRVDDNVQVVLRYRGGARGMLWASQVAPGNENALRLRVFGERGSLGWEQEEPNRLLFSRYGRPTETITRGGPGLGKAATSATRIPSGHPEGYLEAFANIYRDFADVLTEWPDGPSGSTPSLLAGVTEGARAVQFMTAAIQSSRAGATWMDLMP